MRVETSRGSRNAMPGGYLSSLIGRRLNDLRERIQERLATRKEIQEILVVVSGATAEWPEPLLLEKMESALGLVAAHQPMRLNRLRKDLERIHVHPLMTHRASFIRASRTCNLDAFFVATFPPAMIASSVVHEGMHARITAAGIRLPPAREERACRRAELRLGRAMQDRTVIDRATAALALPDEDVAPGIDWGETRRAQRHADLAASGLPGWARRWLSRDA